MHDASALATPCARASLSCCASLSGDLTDIDRSPRASQGTEDQVPASRTFFSFLLSHVHRAGDLRLLASGLSLSG